MEVEDLEMKSEVRKCGMEPQKDLLVALASTGQYIAKRTDVLVYQWI